MSDPGMIFDSSSSFSLGMDSYSNPQSLEANSYVAGMNVTCRGGVVKTRPGSRIMFGLPDGCIQGVTLFTPNTGYPYIVAAVSGCIYISKAPFREYTQLAGVQFAPIAKDVVFTTCQQSTDYDSEGGIVFLDRPKTILVMQDGLSRAAFWDGTMARHLNPTQLGQEATQPGFDETPMGLWSVWSNNRLWVSRENQVFASDIGNPLKFTEAQYLNEARSFYLPSPCTGMVEIPDQSGIIVFTENEGVLLQSSIQNRYQWLSTPEFQKTVIPNVGCAAPRSIVVQYGLIWWFSPLGVQSLNSALRTNVTSKFNLQDNEMMVSKYSMGPNLTGICGAAYENFMAMSVPSGDKYNRHTWVLDQDPFAGGGDINSWASYWTGWRPMCWATGQVFGEKKAYFISKDYDGHNRVWEAFTETHEDNNTPITCFLQTRDHNFGQGDRKKFRYAEIYTQEILGPVEFAAYVAGQRGGYQNIMRKLIRAQQGQVYYDEEYGGGADDKLFATNRVQFRTLKTCELDGPNDCNTCGVESDIAYGIDHAFSLLLVWHGQLGVNGIRLFASTDAENYGGAEEQDETETRSVSFDGCGKIGQWSQEGPFDNFESSASADYIAPCDGLTYTGFADSTTIISQEVADRLAQIRAEEKAAQMVTNACYFSPLPPEPEPESYAGTTFTEGVENFELVSSANGTGTDAMTAAGYSLLTVTMIQDGVLHDFDLFISAVGGTPPTGVAYGVSYLTVPGAVYTEGFAVRI